MRVCRQHTYTHHAACVFPALYQNEGRTYRGRRNMDNVRTELTPLWFHSADSLIKRNVWPEHGRERERKEGNSRRQGKGDG